MALTRGFPVVDQLDPRWHQGSSSGLRVAGTIQEAEICSCTLPNNCACWSASRSLLQSTPSLPFLHLFCFPGALASSFLRKVICLLLPLTSCSCLHQFFFFHGIPDSPYSLHIVSYIFNISCKQPSIACFLFPACDS